MIAPTSNTQSVTLNIRRTTGTGDAVFDDTNTTTKSITSSQTVNVRGNTESSTQGNFILEAKVGTHTLVGSQTFTVISVTIDLRTGSGSASSDNAGRDAYYTNFGTYSLGRVQHLVDPKTWGNGMEYVGTVLPSNFSGTVVLHRYRVAKRVFANSNATPITDVGYGDDFGTASHHDSDPQSGGSNGKVYDIDAPGVANEDSNPVGTILRYRINFYERAEFNGAVVSADFSTFACVSVIKGNDGSDSIISDVSDDDRAGTGSINLTWNLQ